ncbi:MAG: hypothetical protein K2M11_08485, partial [Paramuribaculum sp.]|nr:hypothetical protein [Paramuribaculum sp.]
MKKILVRSLSGAVYVALIVCSLMFGGKWAFPLLCALFALLGVAELEKMDASNAGSGVSLKFIDMAAAFIAVLFPAVSMSSRLPIANIYFPLGISILMLLFIARLVFQLYIKNENAIASISSGAISFLYVAMPLSFISIISVVSG